LDASITSGAEISLIGVSVVFLALVLLMAAVSAVSRLLAPRPSGETAPSTTTPTLEVAAAETLKVVKAPAHFEAMALAAYGYHRRRSQRIRTEPISTHWEIAGRVRQLARSDHRN